MINNVDYIVYDFETGGLDPKKHEAIQIAGQAYNARTLEPYPADQGGQFESLMKPLFPENLEDGALKVNGKTREELAEAPDQGVVWKNFVAWTQKFNKGKGPWTAPIGCGKNIRRFDQGFLEALNERHFKKQVTIFNKRMDIDLEEEIFTWFESEPEPQKYNMDALREYFGLETDGAHDAKIDVIQTGELIMGFIKLKRWLVQRRKSDGGRWLRLDQMVHANRKKA